MPVVAAIPAIIGAGASVAGGLIAKSGADKQAQAAENSSAAAIGEQRREFDINQKNFAPWMHVGSAAIGRLGYLMGLGPGTPGVGSAFSSQSGTSAPNFSDRANAPFMLRNGDNDALSRPRISMMEDGSFGGAGIPRDSVGRLIRPGMQTPQSPQNPSNDPEFGSLARDFTMADFEADPGLEFRLSEGQKSLDRSASARGGINSGAAGKALVRYGQEFGSNEYQNSYNRFVNNQTNKFNRYAALAGSGQTAASTLGAFGTDTARTIGDLTVGGATSAAAARAAGNSALAQGIGNGLTGFMNWYQMLKKNQSSGYNPGDGIIV